MNKKGLSVSDFAAAAGISKQAVYQQLKGRLKDFLLQEEPALISEEAIERFYPGTAAIDSQVKTGLEQGEESSKQADSSPGLEQVEQGKLEQVEQGKEEPGTVDKLIELLQAELENKNKELEKKNQQIDMLHERLSEMTNALNQQQQLHAIDKKQAMLLEDQKQKRSFWDRFRKKEVV